jgi:hypothetical protein
MSEDSRILDIHQTTDQNSSQTRTVAVIVPRRIRKEKIHEISKDKYNLEER